MGSVPILFACSIVISLLAPAAGYPEKCYLCGMTDNEDRKTCYTSPSSSPIQNCSHVLPSEHRDKWICHTLDYKKDGIGMAQRGCSVHSPTCNTNTEEDGVSFRADCCDTDLCNKAGKMTQDLSILFILLILLATLNNALARV